MCHRSILKQALRVLSGRIQCVTRFVPPTTSARMLRSLKHLRNCLVRIHLCNGQDSTLVEIRSPDRKGFFHKLKVKAMLLFFLTAATTNVP
ncbi:hypothetical protein BDN70DRAFT_883518 [Pholiota conissans]|uniref:Uncharacterized protein n=1 Tax=Pholiota conissans TaxID=109636 RepID=A0A9P5YV09_9AGAR|nr:hypothetical protein BDN70DRAFT_883518 [Pholiota conissans]